MVVKEYKSKLFHLRGEGNVKITYSTNGDSSPIEQGRCLYLVRLELAQENHPEIEDDKFDLSVITTMDGMYFAKGLGGGKRGLSGDMVSFEELMKEAFFPKERSNHSVNSNLKNTLGDILDGFHYNCNFKIYSEFNGYFQAFQAKFDEEKTYMPIVMQAFKEVKVNLQKK